MTRLLLLIIIFVSCKSTTNDKDKEANVEKNYEYRITVNTWNAFTGHESKFVLDNIEINTYDSTAVVGLKPLTLYYFDREMQADSKGLTRNDTTQIPFSKTQSDTLLRLTKSFFKSLEFDEYDTIGKLTPVITDDSRGFVELRFRGKTLSATISSISNPTIATKEMDSLRRFVNKFRPVE